MAYGNWGAFVWKNGEYEEDCCDASIDELDIGGHAVINCENLIFEIYKDYFPVIYEKQENKKYKKWDENSFIKMMGIKKLYFDIVPSLYMPEDEKEPTIEDIYYKFHQYGVAFEYKNIKIHYDGSETSIHPSLRELTIIDKDNVWYIVYGMGFGHGGYEKRNVSKCVNKYLKFDNENKKYYYDNRNIRKVMDKAYNRDERNHKIYWTKYYLKDALIRLVKFQFTSFRYSINDIIEEWRD